ncbi:ubiquitin carboxyl-terminal hydrolase [Nitzschia inconspicua]|uniref:Ubiquitin carboxyl-terminal hydrolase n=1 Tax=Nitzschia inconspicua TaxID=303405 RepID=A0A9K3LUX1_9STRA|nr:ubiquitin carboxyl-terminal hydrolase [Nitzschia inconspicua]
MASSIQASSSEEIPEPPYMWENSPLPSDGDLRLWQEVADQLEKQQTVVWTSAVRSLALVNAHLRSSKDARDFMEKYMNQIISILVEQQPTKIGPHERKCVQESLAEAITIISKDIEIQCERGPAAVCVTLEVLATVFNKKKVYYKGHKGNWNVNHYNGLPEVRMTMIELFRQDLGFHRLYKYMVQRMDSEPLKTEGTPTNDDGNGDLTMDIQPTPSPPSDSTIYASDQSSLTGKRKEEEAEKSSLRRGFPTIDQLYHILVALGDSIPSARNAAATAAGNNRSDPKQQQQPSAQLKDMEDGAIEISKATMKYISNCSEESLKKVPTDQLAQVLSALQKIFDRLVVNRRKNTYEFYAFWRSLVWKLITSKSLPLKLFGWQQVDEILLASSMQRPPPRSFLAEGAGCSFVNGEYFYSGAATPDGFALGGSDVSYERVIPLDAEDGTGKKLTLFRCTMRSQQKWWFLSEADEEQPGTDRDIDYYQHKSKEHEEMEPPYDGWITCRNAGVDPSPKLQKKGRMVPPGEEFNTLEHQLAKWAIENDIIGFVLGDSVHREIVARSTSLIKFLASMCERDDGVDGGPNGTPNFYCLNISHLLLAWSNCTRKIDAAVSAQIYQLLVSILPSCPSRIAIPLLREIRDSLVQQDNEKQGNLAEVAEFCTALAIATPLDNTKAHTVVLSTDVRAEILDLLWQVLMHPEASGLKSYDTLKRYVTFELRVEPEGTKHREKYLLLCLQVLRENSKQIMPGSIDENECLKMVELTHFVLQACAREQATSLVMSDGEAIPSLLLDELISFLKRRQHGVPSQTASRKLSSAVLDLNALSGRLNIIRFVFGLDARIQMISSQLEQLWHMCTAPSDREELMVFIASASGTSNHRIPLNFNQTANPQQFVPLPQPAGTAVASDDFLSAAFSEDVCAGAFLTLFCAPTLSFEVLGENAYQSFRLMYRKLQESPAHGQEATNAALDALWRISLIAKNDTVASQAMKDLLSIYNGSSSGSNTMNVDPLQTTGEDFGRRVFDCLSSVKESLDRKEASAELAAERCLRILKTAVGYGDSSISMTTSSLDRLSRVSPESGMEQIVKMLPHGMRGQACYRKVGIMVKKTALQGQGLASYQERDQAALGQLKGATYRFSLDVHPLETLASVKAKVGTKCKCPNSSVKPVSITGRASNTGARFEGSLNVAPDNSVVDELGILQGSELVFFLADRQNAQQSPNQVNLKTHRNTQTGSLSEIFCDDSDGFVDRLFETLLGILESLPWRETEPSNDVSSTTSGTHELVWDLLLAMPTNASVAAQVLFSSNSADGCHASPIEDAMDIDTHQSQQWAKLLDVKNFHRSVYVLLAIDASLQPAVEVLSSLPQEQRLKLEKETHDDSTVFRKGFIESGGFAAVVEFFSLTEDNAEMSQSMKRMGNAVALRILKCCLFGDRQFARQVEASSTELDEAGTKLLHSLVDAQGLLKGLTSMVVADSGISSSAISDILKLLHLLLKNEVTARMFISLPNKISERFLIALLLWDGGLDSSRSVISSAAKIRKNTHDLVLSTPVLSSHAFSWLKNAIDLVEVTSECTTEYFDLMERLVTKSTFGAEPITRMEMASLSTAVCRKLASCPRPANEAIAAIDFSTGVLCGCLSLLRALIEFTQVCVVSEGTNILIKEFQATPWSSLIHSDFTLEEEEVSLIDLMGVIFDAFLSPGGATSVVAICCDKASRQHGFEVVVSAARHCKSGMGYMGLVQRINELISSAAPYLKHKWGQAGGSGEHSSRHGRNTSKYSGLRNQGCTCYMNSFLQQMFMMSELRKSLCSATLPASVRASCGVVSGRGVELVGKKITMQWENGHSYDAIVEGFDDATGMHVIRYEPILLATVGGSNHQLPSPDDISVLPPLLPDEFFLSEGRPGKETGVFEVVAQDGSDKSGVIAQEKRRREVEETEDEANSRHLMEEVQRTFIHLEEGSRGRCFDPRALVEACACLKLEFDVWQQNDASEFATKLLDRLEISLKKWAPEHFHYMHHTFGLKQTKQKICKECGLKTNREEKHMNIDCQIRGKSDIQEALAAMCETEIMEGNNQVFCDNCKKNTDTILRNTISELPNMMILSLKRFDLDYTTFETVKLNSRCAFGQTLNMKRYTLEGVEALEQADHQNDSDTMEPGSGKSALKQLPDEDYEYELAGVLVHAGVAQGGHYYSFIKDRSDQKWYRFDDEDVTPFDPESIEVECFGGKVKKETKWPNGQVHTVESEQYANALMLFYEKVKQKEQPQLPSQPVETDKMPDFAEIKMSSGYDVFEPDVRRSNDIHRWQSFLFDAEFQNFLKGLLGLCGLSSPDLTREPEMDTSSVQVARAKSLSMHCRKRIVEMLSSFLFDVLLYSNDRPALNDWIQKIEQIMSSDIGSAQDFVMKLGIKASEVSSNWLRTYLLECPDQMARYAGVRIFSKAIESSLTSHEEREKLFRWVEAWKEQVAKVEGTSRTGQMPSRLENVYQKFENLAEDPSFASSIGAMISFMNDLVDAIPRSWRFSPELFLFLRNLSSVGPSSGDLIRKALASCLLPARMICIITRQRVHATLRAYFPAASMRTEIADTQIRPEQNAHSHPMMPLSGSHGVSSPEINYRGGTSAFDYIYLFETLGCLMGIPGIVQAPLIVEQDDQGRGRQRIVLTDAATHALREVFQENCDETAPGMGQREIESYLRRSGVDNISSQKIIDMMAKYPTTQGGNGSKGSNFLSLEGFLAYYRDFSQTNEAKVRRDMHTFGFRPDLSRRPRDVRIRCEDDQEFSFSSCESVAMDVLSIFNETPPSLGRVNDLGLSSFRFYEVACSASDQLGEYLLAGSCLWRDLEASKPIIRGALKSTFQATAGWTGSDVVNATMTILRILSSIPDDFQDARIHEIMMWDEGDLPQSGGNKHFGLITAARHLYENRSHQTYPQDLPFAYERYVGFIKELLGLHSVCKWMNENRSFWSWMEGDLFETRHQRGRGQSRNDYSVTREPDDSGIPLDHQNHSDSDGMPGIHDSEEDDEDSRMEDMELYQDTTPSRIVISGAGKGVVNGTYTRDGSFERAFKYSKPGVYQGNKTIFSIFRCNVSNNTKHWYISIVPHGNPPGTSADIDFYSAPVTRDCHELPPLSGWVKANEGDDPAPKLKFVDAAVGEAHSDQTGYDNWSDDQAGNTVQNFV